MGIQFFQGKGPVFCGLVRGPLEWQCYT